MVLHPETGSDLPIGLDRELGRDTASLLALRDALLTTSPKAG